MKWNSAPVGNSGGGPSAPWRIPPPNRWASAATVSRTSDADITPGRALMRFLMLAQAAGYQVEGGSLAGKESSDVISTISRTGVFATHGAANAQKSMVDPAALHPISHRERRRVPAATSAAPTAAHTSLAPRFNAS